MLYATKNAERVSQLHPQVAEKAKEWLRRAEAEGLEVLVTSAYRTKEEQDEIYAKGRTQPGAKVTNVKGGYSYHNYGLAIDFVTVKPDKSLDWTVGPKWRRLAAIAKELGFEWGGDWTGFVDYPHIQYTFGLSIQDLRAGKEPPEPKKPPAVTIASAKKAPEGQLELNVTEPAPLHPDVARHIIHSYLSPAWLRHDTAYRNAVKDGNTKVADEQLKLRDWQHFLADKLREAAGVHE